MTILECSIFPLEGLGKGQMYQCRSRRGGGGKDTVPLMRELEPKALTA